MSEAVSHAVITYRRVQDSSVGTKTRICIQWITGSSLAADGEFFWYGPLATPSLQIASMGSDHCDKKNGGPNRWISCKITPRSLKIRLSLFEKSDQFLAGDAQIDLG